MCVWSQISLYVSAKYSPGTTEVGLHDRLFDLVIQTGASQSSDQTSQSRLC